MGDSIRAGSREEQKIAARRVNGGELNHFDQSPSLVVWPTEEEEEDDSNGAPRGRQMQGLNDVQSRMEPSSLVSETIHDDSLSVPI